ncbi:Unknown protein, partial [Striga hermonthica]
VGLFRGSRGISLGGNWVGAPVATVCCVWLLPGLGFEHGVTILSFSAVGEVWDPAHPSLASGVSRISVVLVGVSVLVLPAFCIGLVQFRGRVLARGL